MKKDDSSEFDAIILFSGYSISAIPLDLTDHVFKIEKGE